MKKQRRRKTNGGGEKGGRTPRSEPWRWEGRGRKGFVSVEADLEMTLTGKVISLSLGLCTAHMVSLHAKIIIPVPTIWRTCTYHYFPCNPFFLWLIHTLVRWLWKIKARHLENIMLGERNQTQKPDALVQFHLQGRSRKGKCSETENVSVVSGLWAERIQRPLDWNAVCL